MTDTLPALQFAVLTIIDGTTPGYVVRDVLAKKYRVERSLPAFYQLMARLESDGMVKGSYRQKIVGDQPTKERVYVRTAKGLKAIEATRRFYAGE